MKPFTTFVFSTFFVLVFVFQTELFAQETAKREIPRFVIGPPGKTELTAYLQMIENSQFP